MAVTGLQCVPEEHDVRGEMQTLQVMSRGRGGSGACPLRQSQYVILGLLSCQT